MIPNIKKYMPALVALLSFGTLTSCDDDNVKDELVDILHFFTAACIHSGMDAKELYERYMRKNKENFDRQYGKSQKHGYELDKM